MEENFYIIREDKSALFLKYYVEADLMDEHEYRSDEKN